jgi:hypothetical protein
MFVDALEVAHATNTSYRSTDVARSKCHATLRHLDTRLACVKCMVHVVAYAAPSCDPEPSRTHKDVLGMQFS